MKRKIDEFLKENLDINYEDLRVNNPNERQFLESIFEVLDINEEDIGMIDLNAGMPAILEKNEISEKAKLQKGDRIIAEVYSDPEDGMTNEWFFLK